MITSTLTQDDYQTMIGAETGATDFNAQFVTLFPLWWQRYEPKPEDAQYLWVKLRTCQFLMGQYRKRYDVVRGTDQSRVSQQFTAARNMAADVMAELKAIDLDARGINVGQFARGRSSMPDAIEIVSRFELPQLLSRRTL